MKYYAMPMHLHSAHEPTASIGAHMSRAVSLGMKYIWLTEHDIRMGKKAKAVPCFSYSEQSLVYVLENGVDAGFLESEANTGGWTFSKIDEGYELNVSVHSGENERLTFQSRGKVHCDPLFANIAVELDADIEAIGDGTVSIEFVLSAQPPTYQQARLVYSFGDVAAAVGNVPTIVYPFPEKNASGRYRFELTKDVKDEIGGLDNALCTLELVLKAANGSSASLTFRSLEFFRELNYEPVRREQMKLAQKLGEHYGITPFVSYEISGAGHHMNVYSTRVPVINYEERSFKVTSSEAIEHVLSYGGIFSYNHPLSEWNYAGLSEDEKWELVDTLAEKFIKNRVLGASLMEVGFPENKGAFDEKFHLALWDKLSLGGIMISGDGDSDNHFARDVGWTTGNNFCSYIGIFDGEEPTEDAFVRAMKRGSLWFGDPSVMGEISFGCDKSPQGSVTVGDSRVAEISVSGVGCEGELVRIVDGLPDAKIALVNGAASDLYTLIRNGKFSFVRYEIRNSGGRLVASTNPLYIAKSLADIDESEIAEGRLVCE